MKRLRSPLLPILLLPLLLVACHSQGADDTEPQEIDQILRILQLSPGMSVADLGAGDGDWAEDLLPAVGEDGTLWATEVEDDMVEDLRQRFEDQKNVQVVLGDDQATGLPTGCCDALFVRLVYHHFTDPVAMRADLHKALRPGGKLLIVDIEPQDDWGELDGVPDRGGHGIPMASLIGEMTGDGFRVVERFETWPEDEDKYAVLFEVSAVAPTGSLLDP